LTCDLDPEIDLDGVKMNQHSKYLGQRTISSKVIVWTQTRTHTHNGAKCSKVWKESERQCIVHLSVKATSVEQDLTWLCTVLDCDENAAKPRRQTFDDRPDAVDRCQINAVDGQFDLRITQHRSNERRDNVFRPIDVHLLKSRLMLGLIKATTLHISTTKNVIRNFYTSNI